MAINNLRLVDSDDNIFNFPYDFYIKDDPWQVSSNTKNIAFAHGGKDIADGFLQPRSITIEGYIRGDTLAEVEALERQIQTAVLKGGKLYVIGDVVNRYWTVSAPNVSSNYINDYLTEKQYNVNYLLEFPAWEDNTETECQEVLADVTGGSEFTVDNSGSDILIFPVITIQANQGDDLPYVRLLNRTDGGMFFEYEDPFFVVGDTVIIDCKEGTVKRNGNDTLQYFTTPRFLRLQPVINTFLYEGDASTVTITFRKAYL